MGDIGILKKLNYILTFSIFSLALLVSCGGSSSDDIVVEGPSDLTLEAVIAGIDGSNPNEPTIQYD